MTPARALALLVGAIAVGAVACHHAPPVERQPVGTACQSDESCGASPPFSCATDHPGGYCEATCGSDRECPAGAVCVGAGLLSKGDCHRKCSAEADCRASEGYRCIAGAGDATHDYCDPPDRSEVARRLRGRAWRW